MDSIKVALVDDHQLVRAGIANLVKSFPNYMVFSEHDNGKEFTDDLMFDNLPQVVLLDVNMPLMDGFATAAFLKKHAPEIPVLALSMLDDDATIVKMIRHGAKGYILKNTTAQELQIALDTVLKDGFYHNQQTLDKRSDIDLIKNENKENNKLSDNELKYILYSAHEKTTKEIADLLCISIRTLEYYREAVYQKTKTKSKIGMILYAIKHKLIDLDL